MSKKDEPQDADLVQAVENEMLQRAKEVARRIQDRVKGALADTDEAKALSDATDEQKPLPSD